MIAARAKTALLGLPIGVLLGVFFALPLLFAFSLAFRSFDVASMSASGFQLRNFPRFLDDRYYLMVFAQTVGIAAAVTAICVVLGYPVAWHLHRLGATSLRSWLMLVVLLPLMLSLVVASFAWVTILGGNGLLNRLIIGAGLADRPLSLLGTVTGVIIVTAYSHIPYTTLSIYAALENIDPSVIRAARLHGASDAQTFLRIILPLSLPGVVSGALIVFALSMAAFVVPYLIGGGRVKVVALLIYQFVLQLFDWSGAAALAVILFIVTAAVTWLLSGLARRWTVWEHRG